MITREEALALIKKYLRNKENIKISLSVESILRALAKILGENEEIWGLTGLLFNIDYEYTEDDKENRGTISAQILKDLLPEKGINAIQSNNYLYTDVLPVSSLDRALISAEAAVKLILEAAKATPSKNVSDLTTEFVLEKLNDESFISDKTVSRLKLCKDSGLTTEEFLNLALINMRNIFSNE